MTEKTLKELLGELDAFEKEEKKRFPARPLKRGAKIAIGIIVVIAVAGLVAAAVLFTHTLSFVPPLAKLSSGCPSPSDPILPASSMIIFSCGTSAALGVNPGASGSVTYSAFTGFPSQISGISLVDHSVALGSSCAATTSSGNEPIPLPSGGGTVSISASPGLLRPGHFYDYCFDFTTLPSAFTASVTWSQ